MSQEMSRQEKSEKLEIFGKISSGEWLVPARLEDETGLKVDELFSYIARMRREFENKSFNPSMNIRAGIAILDHSDEVEPRDGPHNGKGIEWAAELVGVSQPGLSVSYNKWKDLTENKNGYVKRSEIKDPIDQLLISGGLWLR